MGLDGPAESEAVEAALEQVVLYFDRGGVLQLADTASAAACLEGFRTVPGLLDAARLAGLSREDSDGHTAAACELVLEALVAERRISRSDSGSYTRASRRAAPPPTGGGMGPKLPYDL